MRHVCVAEVHTSAVTMCRPGSGDVCDPDETCTGTNASCPADAVKPSSFECRASAGVCDTAESCKIGRASGRERVEISVVAGSLQKKEGGVWGAGGAGTGE